MITIVNKKLRQYLQEKDTLVKKGRKKSEEIEEVEKGIEAVKEEQRKYTNDCNPTDLIKLGDALRDKINKDIEELEKIGAKIQQIKIEAIPQKLKDRFDTLKKAKEVMERDRNKIALTVQKIKDRAIPLIQKEMKSHLKEYDDIETAVLKGEKIQVTVYNRLEEWKAGFKKDLGKKL